MLYFCGAKQRSSIALLRANVVRKGFINFGFWFWRPPTLNGGSLFYGFFTSSDSNFFCIFAKI